jgi:hypothetical protein
MTPREVEAMARAMCEALYPSAWPSVPASQRAPWDAQAQAALTALCALHPGISAVLDGSAVVVPREATVVMQNAAVEAAEMGGGMSWSNRSPQSVARVAYRAMLASSPYATPPSPAADGDGA